MSKLSKSRQLQRLPGAARHETSNLTLAVVMAGIAAVFIVSIASAFIYAKGTNPAQLAQAPQPAATVSAPVKSAPETTGSAVK